MLIAYALIERCGEVFVVQPDIKVARVAEPTAQVKLASNIYLYGSWHTASGATNDQGTVKNRSPTPNTNNCDGVLLCDCSRDVAWGHIHEVHDNVVDVLTT